MCVRVYLSGLNAMQNLAALAAAAATGTPATPTGSSALTTSSSPLSALTSSGKKLHLYNTIRLEKGSAHDP